MKEVFEGMAWTAPGEDGEVTKEWEEFYNLDIWNEPRLRVTVEKIDTNEREENE